MTADQLLEQAKAEGFTAVLIEPEDVPIDKKFRAFCEENLCGYYNANYSCPPDCGSVEDLHQALLAQEKVLVLQAIHHIGSYENKSAVNGARISHNGAILRLADKLRKAGYQCICAGYNGCPLCDPCKRKENQPCAHPNKRITCMSAYCVDAAKLAKKCGMDFAWVPDRLYLFGMIAFRRLEQYSNG